MNQPNEMISQVANDVSVDPAARASWIADILEKIGPEASTEAGLLRYMHSYADTVAKHINDFKHSAEIRIVIENPERDAKAYQNLLNAAKFHILGNVFHDMAQHLMGAANGLLKAATKKIPSYEPMIAVPDNALGNFLMDSFEDVHIKTGASGAFIKRNVKPEDFMKPDTTGPGKKIIID